LDFLKIWFMGIVSPSVSFAELQKKPAPVWGFWAIIVRFVVTSLTSVLALRLLDRKPFVPSYLTFLPTERYYDTEVFFLPVFGLGGWLLGSAVVHLILRLAQKESDFDWILNVVGWSLLVVMPVVWLVDWLAIALNMYGAGFTPVLHALVSVWEVALMGIGLNKMKGIGFWPACLLGLVAKGGIYIPLAIIFVR
jgi:hypothetical protein